MNTDVFSKTVQQSRMLTREQKALLLEDPDGFSSEYRKHIVSLLAAFDLQSEHRETFLRERINELLNGLYDRLEAEQVPDVRRKEIIDKAMAAAQGLFPSSPA